MTSLAPAVRFARDTLRLYGGDFRPAAPRRAAGVTEDFGLAAPYADARVLRIVDGPDEAHRNQIGQLELRKNN
jgi:alkylation response protein AidB-like acyl-CoA dehydrogenase